VVFNIKEMSVVVIINPLEQHLKEIADWLLEEEKILKKGFFCQIPTIKASFNMKKLIVITENSKAIGFLTYHFSFGSIVNIEIAEIKPDKRRMGFGKILLKESCNWFIKQGALVAQLFYSPESTGKIWKKMGFMDFQSGIIKESSIYLYKILVDSTECYIGNEEVERIELWDSEDYKNEIEPNWKWELKRKEGLNELIKPIIQPSNDEWSVSHVINGQITEKKIMKNFDKKRHDGGYFLIVKEYDK